MLDTQTRKSTRGRGALHGQRILILGASDGFGRAMARAFAGSGAKVIAADTDAAALDRVDRAIPLALNGAPEDALRRVGRKWGEARLDAVLNLMPLRAPRQIDQNIAVLQGIVQGFMPALTAREGQIITVASRPEQALDVGAGAMVPALRAAQDAFAATLHRDGLSLNLVTVREDAITPARAAVMGLMMGSVGPLTGAELRL
ncbi:SDR family NAD(P)-dependent oxidoreductase [Sulfitobacter albidus]|uniref:SDR family NAD(P)-dependent oxidoreductase n=1 Tax=Sulfitobacter albidus TaxID=2829501 RepID=A0A975PNF7_9RHOB|nr:SDR family NAD(P)-dependent oxidoreductase [Sulfitobacter albidus]QUJ77807.1 SDR family NAD(P)-dependent oxidoreductase [Sulfitobacter albidus]